MPSGQKRLAKNNLILSNGLRNEAFGTIGPILLNKHRVSPRNSLSPAQSILCFYSYSFLLLYPAVLSPIQAFLCFYFYSIPLLYPTALSLALSSMCIYFYKLPAVLSRSSLSSTGLSVLLLTQLLSISRRSLSRQHSRFCASSSINSCCYIMQLSVQHSCIPQLSCVCWCACILIRVFVYVWLYV